MQRVFSYIRQMSFIADSPSRYRATENTSDGSFITKFLQGKISTDSLKHCPIYSGKEPCDLPDLQIKDYEINPVTASITGPDDGLKSVQRSRHESINFMDSSIDFIDTEEEIRHSHSRQHSKKSNISRGNVSRIPTLEKIDSICKSRLCPPDSSSEKNDENNMLSDSFQDINWKFSSDDAYGISISLYEKHLLTGDHIGSPIADCYGLIARKNVCIMALSDGVNWGEASKLAARSAIYGSLEYLNRALFSPNNLVKSTREIFSSLLRSFWEAQDCILELNGGLTTLIVCVILPIANDENNYVVCSCNVGDSLGFVYSKSNGVREFTQGSHDITSMRDMRDALGALGPVDGKNPELGNLTLSMTTVEKGDIVFLTSDGVTDNFDPVVGKFADVFSVNESPTNQKENISKPVPSKPRSMKSNNFNVHGRKTEPNRHPTTALQDKKDVPVHSHHLKKDPNANTTQTNKNLSKPNKPVYLRSKTLIEPRRIKSPIMSPTPEIRILKSSAGLPLVTGPQRHALTLLRMEDLFLHGINGSLHPCNSAKKLCYLLIDFSRMITLARRKMLEQRELFYKVAFDVDGRKKEVELSRNHHRAARKRTVESTTFKMLPGKLDHSSCVAFKVGGGVHIDPTLKTLSITSSYTYTETNF